MKKQILQGILAAGILATGVVTAAEAGGRHGKHFGFYKHYGPSYVSYKGSGCGYYYSKWKHSGSFYWKNRYFECSGGY